MRVAVGSGEVPIDLPAGARLGSALDALFAAHPELENHRRSIRAAIGTEYATGDPVLREGDEISLIPPVQGG